MTGNIAASCWHHGFHYEPEECPPNGDILFFDNVAHSISGYGAIAANVEGNPNCIEVKDFAAYKCT